MENKTYNNAIDILNYAIENQLSTKKASVEKGYADSYFKNVKKRVYEIDGYVSTEDAEAFKALYEKYILQQNKVRATAPTIEEVDFDEKKSSKELQRNNKGFIEKYWFKIVNKDGTHFENYLTRAEVELIYTLYPNNTVEELSREFVRFTKTDLQKILRLFDINKNKRVPQHILEEQDIEKQESFVLRAKEKSLEKRVSNNQAKYFEGQYIKLKQELYQLQQDNKWAEDIVSNLLKRKPLKSPENTPKHNGKSPLYIMFGDTHYGKNFKGTIFGRDYNKDVAHERVMSIAEYIVSEKDKHDELILIFVGDLLESIQEGGMHHMSHRGMDLEGEDQIYFAYDSLNKMLEYILNNFEGSVKFYVMGGNHDRIGEKREYDKKRTASSIVFNFLKRKWEDEDRFEIIIPDMSLQYFRHEDLYFIIHHGDSSLAKKRPIELVNLYGVGKEAYHIVVQGHWHSGKMEQGNNYSAITLNSVCSSDDYCQNELGLNNLAGYTVVKGNLKSGLDISFKTLY